MSVPFDYHRYIIGTKGSGVRQLMDDYGVDIAIPPARDESDEVVVSGPPKHVEDALEGLKRRVEEIKADLEEKVRDFEQFSRSFKKFGMLIHALLNSKRTLVFEK